MRRRIWNGLLAAAALEASLPALATQETAQKEALMCTACHDKGGSNKLTTKGEELKAKGVTMDSLCSHAKPAVQE